MKVLIAGFFSIILLNGCMLGYTGDCEVPPSHQVKTRMICNINLSPDSLVFIDTSISFKLESSNHFLSTFNRSVPKYFDIKQEFDDTAYEEEDHCSGKVRLWGSNYALCEQEERSYTSAEVPFVIKYVRKSVLKIDNKDSIKRGTFHSYEDVNISISTKSRTYLFQLPINGLLTSKMKLFDTLRLNNMLFNDVYVISNDTLNSKVVEPAGVYYNFNNKFLGFYLSNGEVWALKP